MWKKFLAISCCFAAVFSCLFGFADVAVADENGEVVGYTNEHWRLTMDNIKEAVNNVAGDPDSTTNDGATARSIMNDIEFFSVITTMVQCYDPTIKQSFTLTRTRGGATYTLTCYNGEGPWDIELGNKIVQTFDAGNTTTWQVANSIAKTWSHASIEKYDATFFKEISNFFRTVISYIEISFTYIRMGCMLLFDTAKMTIKIIDIPIYLLGIGDLIRI